MKLTAEYDNTVRDMAWDAYTKPLLRGFVSPWKRARLWEQAAQDLHHLVNEVLDAWRLNEPDLSAAGLRNAYFKAVTKAKLGDDVFELMRKILSEPT